MTAPSPVTICDHPLVANDLAILRSKETACEAFRQAIRRVSRTILYEATRDLPVTNATVETPLATTTVQVIREEDPLILVPILRAGLMLSEVGIEMLPWASVYHIGLYRNEETFEPVTYYNKLPSQWSDHHTPRVFVLDPMLATGGSATAAIEIIAERFAPHPVDIRLLCVIAAPEGIKAVHDRFPGVRIVTAAVDERLNEKAYIVPGLGDAGDRTFGTLM
ncbi:MAG: uracil phosphoribosyltransferase [Candidatus Melainabacteria bacterium]